LLNKDLLGWGRRRRSGTVSLRLADGEPCLARLGRG